MKSHILRGVLTAFLLSGTAHAADIAKAPTIAPAVPFTWSGLYAGGFAGYGTNDNDNATASGGDPASLTGFACTSTVGGCFHGAGKIGGSTVTATGTGAASNGTFSPPLNLGTLGGIDSLNPNSNGAVFGGRIGANLQFGKIVLGVEDELAWSGMSGSQSINGAGFTPNLGAGASFTQTSYGSISTSVNWYDAFVARLGFTPYQEVLFFAKVGGVYGGISSSAVIGNQLSLVTAGDLNGNLSAVQAGNGDTSKFGWTWGFGVEYAFGLSGWSARLDYTQFNFGSINYAVTGVPTGGLSGPHTAYTGAFQSVSSNVSQSLNYGTVTFGLDYKFGS